MIATARAALVNLLTTDPLFVADMQALGLGTDGSAATPGQVAGNRPFEQIGQNNYPCWVHDTGDMLGASAGNFADTAAGLVLGSDQQDWQADILLSLVWYQKDFATAVSQTDAVQPALVRLLLRNPGLADSCTLAYVADVQPDRGMRHPTHSIAFSVRVHFTIERDAP